LVVRSTDVATVSEVSPRSSVLAWALGGLEVAVRHAERNLGRLLLGHRRGHKHYSEHDRAAIQRSADALGEALAVGHDLGHVHPPKPGSM
jgi:hypothetical protein